MTDGIVTMKERHRRKMERMAQALVERALPNRVMTKPLVYPPQPRVAVTSWLCAEDEPTSNAVDQT